MGSNALTNTKVALQVSDAFAMDRGARRSLPLVMPHQEKDHWCWAAVSVSVAAFYGSGPTRQCDVACAVLGKTTCCAGSPGSDECDVDGQLEDGLLAVGHFARIDPRALVMQEIVQAINAGTPLGVRVQWNGEGAHFVAISGYGSAGGAPTLDIHDPWHGDAIAFSAGRFPGQYHGGGIWTDSYFTA